MSLVKEESEINELSPELIEQNCDLCRKRKLKCSRELPQCKSCIKFNKKCVYSPKARRSPLTRSRLTALEKKLFKLEKIMKRAFPNMSIEEIAEKVDQKDQLDIAESLISLQSAPSPSVSTLVKNGEQQPPLNADNAKAQVSSAIKNETDQSRSKKIPARTTDPTLPNMSQESQMIDRINEQASKSKKMTRDKKNDSGNQKIVPTDTPNDPLFGFDWTEVDEDQKFVQNDGMAALTTDPNNKGYFGQGSSAILLRAALKNNDSLTQNKKKIEDLIVTTELEQQLGSLEIREMFVNAYFEHYHTSYPFLDKEFFMMKFKEYEGADIDLQPHSADPDDAHTTERYLDWKILLNTVCAIGCWCLHGESLLNIDLFYYKEVKKCFKGTLFERGNILLVVSFTLLSNYAQKRNKPNSGWNYLGLAVRMAIGLGLYKEFDWHVILGNSKYTHELEVRRRLWWGIYIFDAGVAITFGRPINLPNNFIYELALPSNIDDYSGQEVETKPEGFPTKREKGEKSLPKPPQVVDYPTIYSGLIEQTKFTKISVEIHNRLLARPSPSAKECLQLNEKIKSFVENLPSWFSKNDNTAYSCCEQLKKNSNNNEIPHWFHLTRYRLIWRYLNLQIILFRGFVWQNILGKNDANFKKFFENPTTSECIEICLDSSGQSIEYVAKYIETCKTPTNVSKDVYFGSDPRQTSTNANGLKNETEQYSELSVLGSWYATYFLFQATLVPVICLVYYDARYKNFESWKKQILVARKLLSILQVKNKTAGDFIKIIDSVCGNILSGKSVSKNFKANESSSKEELSKTGLTKNSKATTNKTKKVAKATGSSKKESSMKEKVLKKNLEKTGNAGNINFNSPDIEKFLDETMPIDSASWENTMDGSNTNLNSLLSLFNVPTPGMPNVNTPDYFKMNNYDFDFSPNSQSASQFDPSRVGPYFGGSNSETSNLLLVPGSGKTQFPSTLGSNENDGTQLAGNEQNPNSVLIPVPPFSSEMSNDDQQTGSNNTNFQTELLNPTTKNDNSELHKSISNSSFFPIWNEQSFYSASINENAIKKDGEEIYRYIFNGTSASTPTPTPPVREFDSEKTQQTQQQTQQQNSLQKS
ncbi:hypothetical protein ACO0QE_003421 [Hanseniaspora vineae]